MRISGLRTLVASALLTAGGSAGAQDGAELPNRGDALDGITTAGQPTESALAKLADAGYTTVIDLRGTDEDRGYDEAGAVEELGMRYVSLPISGNEAISYENAARLDELLAGAEGPVLLHCSSSNRAGALLSLRARLHGADAADALALGEQSGVTGMRSLVEEVLATRPPE